MAGPAPDWNVPDQNNNKFTDIATLRDGMWPTFIGAILHAGAVLPGWDLTAETHDGSNRPLTITWTNQDSPPMLFRVTYTYSGGSMATAKFDWDYGGGSGWEAFSIDVATITTDANYNVTAITWA